ncbi:hypothetical protein AVEN_51303-1 [Araneus ventricosus]|uniref:Uncharacterized protein n=1 Tax=Araneus ventricosus TaxID=182803 RepID=A0A4Y2QLE8_ARAVE|nr:hypothetical protein AVEN_51303-1 [Araneus ventricosus]
MCIRWPTREPGLKQLLPQLSSHADEGMGRICLSSSFTCNAKNYECGVLFGVLWRFMCTCLLYPTRKRIEAAVASVSPVMLMNVWEECTYPFLSSATQSNMSVEDSLGFYRGS